MRQVLEAAAAGMSSSSTAAALGVSVYTVDAIRAAARARLDEPTTERAAARARLTGLI